jgi:hypothetical protein
VSACFTGAGWLDPVAGFVIAAFAIVRCQRYGGHRHPSDQVCSIFDDSGL